VWVEKEFEEVFVEGCLEVITIDFVVEIAIGVVVVGTVAPIVAFFQRNDFSNLVSKDSFGYVRVPIIAKAYKDTDYRDDIGNWVDYSKINYKTKWV
jgi:hypothetical protein